MRLVYFLSFIMLGQVIFYIKLLENIHLSQKSGLLSFVKTCTYYNTLRFNNKYVYVFNRSFHISRRIKKGIIGDIVCLFFLLNFNEFVKTPFLRHRINKIYQVGTELILEFNILYLLKGVVISIINRCSMNMKKTKYYKSHIYTDCVYARFAGLFMWFLIQIFFSLARCNFFLQ